MVSYEDLLNKEQEDFIVELTDELGFNNCDNIRWTVGTGWDGMDAESVEFQFWDNAENMYTSNEKPVYVKVNLLGLTKKSVSVEMGELFKKTETLKMPNRPKYVASMVKARWRIINGKR